MQKPAIVPTLLPANIPIIKTYITNKLGFMPAIVNQSKKFICKKYIKKNIKISTITATAFFK